MGQLSWLFSVIGTPGITTMNPWGTSLEPSKELEAESEIWLLKRKKDADAGEGFLVLFKLEGMILINALTSLLRDVRNKKCTVIMGELLIVPIFENNTLSINLHGIRLIPTLAKLLTAIVLRRLTLVRESNIRAHLAGFNLDRGSTDQVFTL